MARSLILLLAVVLTLAAPTAVHAQDEDTTAAPRPRGRLIEPLAGLRMGFPQKLSGYVGVGLAKKRFERGYTGWAITVEPGLGGGMVGIGPSASGGIGMIARVQGAVLRTWGDPWLVGPDRTYVGLDSRVSIGYIGLSAGGYVRLPGNGAGPGVMLSTNLVFGL